MAQDPYGKDHADHPFDLAPYDLNLEVLTSVLASWVLQDPETLVELMINYLGSHVRRHLMRMWWIILLLRRRLRRLRHRRSTRSRSRARRWRRTTRISLSRTVRMMLRRSHRTSLWV
ncbi:GSCOCG00004531001-RA-CDS [Cotesia congregata]|nr:GSCOCG00004531001-RA-CDS [Cotesia congregata]